MLCFSLELFFLSSVVVLNDPDEKFLELPDLPLSTLLNEPLLYPLDEPEVVLLLLLVLELLVLVDVLDLLELLLDLETFDLPPLDLKLLELDLLLDLNPELDLNPLELLVLADTVISPWVTLSNIDIVSIRKLEVRKTKVNSKVSIIFLLFLLFLFIYFTSKKRIVFIYYSRKVNSAKPI